MKLRFNNANLQLISRNFLSNNYAQFEKKREILSHTKKIFREINSLVTSLVKTENVAFTKFVREKFRNFQTVFPEVCTRKSLPHKIFFVKSI